jgi:hypothetical protein
MNCTLSPEAVPSTTNRATGGRFAKGNPGGPGNPFARQTAALRAALINGVAERDIQEILDVLLLNAKGGHLPAIKFLFSYVIGKPQPAVNPDVLDVQEMQLFQQSALPPEALETLGRQLPLPFLLQLLHFAQASNEAHAAHDAQETLTAENEKRPQRTEPATRPEPRTASTAPVAVPSTNPAMWVENESERDRVSPGSPGGDFLREQREEIVVGHGVSLGQWATSPSRQRGT